MSRHRRPWIAACLAACLAAWLAACGGAPPDGGALVLHRGNDADPETLDPQAARSVSAQNVLRDLGEGLLVRGPDGRLAPGVAASWTVEDEGRHYRFKLRPDARWSNGDPVTAVDFVFAFRRLVDPATGAFYGDLLRPVEGARAIRAGDAPPEALGVEAPDRHRLEIRLEAPAPWFPEILALPATHPVHRPSLAAHGEAAFRPPHRVANGPFVAVAWTVGGELRLEKNRHHHAADTVALDAVVYHPLADRRAEYNRFRAGELHVTGGVPVGTFAALARDRAPELRVAPYLGVYYLGFRVDSGPWASRPAARRALSMAIDRERLARDVVGRGERPAWAFVPPELKGAAPARLDWADDSPELRRAEAARLWAEAGEPHPRVELRYPSGAEHRRIAAAVQAMWRETLGVEAELVEQEFRVLLQSVRAGEGGFVFRGSWIADYPDATSFLGLFRSGNPANPSGFADPAYDAALDAAALATGDERLAALARAEALLLDADAVIPIYHYVSKRLVSPRVTGWRDDPLDVHPSRHLGLSP